MKRAYVAGLACLLVGVALYSLLSVIQRMPEPPIPKIPLVGAEPRCRAAYLNLFHGDQLDVRLVFGYKDARPARLVGDRYERAAILDRITNTEGPDALGFSRDPRDDDHFTRVILGPDGKAKTVH